LDEIDEYPDKINRKETYAKKNPKINFTIPGESFKDNLDPT
jgi:hypothetical protein